MNLQWQIDFMDFEMFIKPKKGTLVSPQCTFSYFKVDTHEGYEKFRIMVNNLRLPIDEVRLFDPKRFVTAKRSEKILSGIYHELLYTNDVFRKLIVTRLLYLERGNEQP